MVVQKLNQWVFKRGLPLLLRARSHYRLQRVLNTAPVASLAVRHPAIRYKYLRANYLMGSLSTSDSLYTMIHHYRSLGARIKPCFFARLFDESPAIWEHHDQGHDFKIRLSFPRHLRKSAEMHDHEGDLSLIFEMDGTPLYVLCMTLVPGKIAASRWGVRNLGGAMFVGRVQGVRNQMEELRTATKTLKDIAPPRILLCAVEALTRTFGADVIIGVSNAEQLSRRMHEDEAESFFDYDSFWQQAGAQATRAGLFWTPAQLPEKPIELVQQKHRSRTMAKRNFRRAITDHISNSFAHSFLH